MPTRIQHFFFVSLLVLTSLFSFGRTSMAQEFQLYSADDIIVETTPEIPGPNEQTTIKIKSYSFNLNNYYIAWFENGEQKSAGYGNREFTFKTGTTGTTTKVTALVEVGEQVFKKEFRFSPSRVDLLWEVSDAYVPPFYKGKALPIRQSTVKITAIPETMLLSPSDAPNLVYYWDKDYVRETTKSGYGRQSYSITTDPLTTTNDISVTVNDRRENSFAKNTIELATNVFEPKILFYEVDDHDRIMTNKALNANAAVNGDTIKLSFHPLFMSTTEQNFTDLFVQWNLNGDNIPPQDFEKQNELYISSGGKTGSVSISVTLEGIVKILQQKTENFSLVFTKQN